MTSLADQILDPRQSRPHGQHVFPGDELKHLAVLDLQDPAYGTDRFVEKVAEIRSGQSALPQPCHRFMLESLYPQLLFRHVPALSGTTPSCDGPRVNHPGMGTAHG